MNPPDPSRLCIHTMTTKPWSLDEAVEHFSGAGIGGITVWRQHLPDDIAAAGRRIRDAGLRCVSLCRGGFFPAVRESDRGKAVDDNLRAIDQAHALGTDLIVLVCGAVPGLPLAESRRHIADGIAAVLPRAVEAGVRLAIEPLHPVYAADRSAINTMAQANDLCDQLGSPDHLGIALDVYHVWWDSDLPAQIERAAGGGRLHAFHVCDWKTEPADMLNDRGLMGEGVIDIRSIRRMVEQAGFTGAIEVEIFSDRYWAMDQHHYLGKILQACREHV